MAEIDFIEDSAELMVSGMGRLAHQVMTLEGVRRQQCGQTDFLLKDLGAGVSAGALTFLCLTEWGFMPDGADPAKFAESMADMVRKTCLDVASNMPPGGARRAMTGQAGPQDGPSAGDAAQGSA